MPSLFKDVANELKETNKTSAAYKKGYLKLIATILANEIISRSPDLYEDQLKQIQKKWSKLKVSSIEERETEYKRITDEYIIIEDFYFELGWPPHQNDLTHKDPNNWVASETFILCRSYSSLRIFIALQYDKELIQEDNAFVYDTEYEVYPDHLSNKELIDFKKYIKQKDESVSKQNSENNERDLKYIYDDDYEITGLYQGSYQAFHPEGQLQFEGFYKDGLKNGIWKHYTKAGILWTSATWKNNKYNGIKKIFKRSNGDPMRVEIYENDKLIKLEFIDQKIKDFKKDEV